MWYQIKNQQVEIRIFVKPNAKQTALIKVNDNGLNVALHAKPHEGEANKELVVYLSKLFQIPKSHIILQRGINSRYKTVVIPLTVKIRVLLESLKEQLKK